MGISEVLTVGAAGCCLASGGLHSAGVLEKETGRGGIFLQFGFLPHLLQQEHGEERNGPVVVLRCLLLPSALSANPKTCLFPLSARSDAALRYTGHLAVGDTDVPANTHRKTLKMAGSVPGKQMK